MAEQYGPLIKLTGVWQKTSAKGVIYFTGRLGAAKLVILPNRDKKTDGDPDMIVFVQEPQPKPEQKPNEKPVWDGIPDPGEPVSQKRRAQYEDEQEF